MLSASKMTRSWALTKQLTGQMKVLTQVRTYVGEKKTGARTDKKTFWAKKGSQGQEKHAGVKPVRLFLTELFEGSSEKCPGPASDAPSSSLEM